MDLKVVIIEDNPRYRDSLETLFKHAPGFCWCASFGSALAALDELERLERASQEPAWQIALVDIELPVMNGIEAIRRLKKYLPNLLRDSQYNVFTFF